MHSLDRYVLRKSLDKAGVEVSVQIKYQNMWRQSFKDNCCVSAEIYGKTTCTVSSKLDKNKILSEQWKPAKIESM